ncbi:MAG: pyruvate kinase [Armatimonadota bacterium]|nr:pyruvate kinase [Armatimonadota bacterium]
MRKTKIVCTIGPASSSPEALAALIKAGMDVARLNFSHGSYEEHAARITEIRRISTESGRLVGVLQDLSGPKIRLGQLVQDPVCLEPGQKFTFTSRPVPGDSHEANLPHPELISQVKKGALIFADDAKLEFKVISVTDTDIVTKVIIGGPLGSRKGITVPGAALPIAALTEKDKADLKFGLKAGVDWVAMSFVRSHLDIEPIHKIMEDAGISAPVIAKIERPEAVRDIDAIIAAFDGIMIARGDLGIELPIDKVPLIQKSIIKKCNKAGKPVITATQMLDSMMRNPQPTRAEVTDVANAILDGSDATMLSGETAVGDFPVRTVQMMARIAVTTERSLPYEAISHSKYVSAAATVTDAIGEAAAELTYGLGLSAIITSTATGGTARRISKYRPRARIIAAASSASVARQLTLSWGVIPLSVPICQTTDETIEQAITAAKKAKLVKSGEMVVVTGGFPVGVPGRTNLIKVERVD